MRFQQKVSIIVMLAAFGRLLFSYLDPGSGSLIIQLLVGALLSSLFFVKVFWTRIKNALRGAGKSTDDSPTIK